MQLKLRTLLLPFLVMVLVFFTNLSYAQNAYQDAGRTVPTVTSDKDDYAPGETAIITGMGWTLDDTVDVHLEEDPYHEHEHAYHGIKVNSDGTWRIEYPIEERHLGVKFTVIVEGKASGYKGYAYFTDGQLQSFTIGSQSITPAAGTVTSVSYSSSIKVAANNNNTAVITLNVSGLPAGVNFSPTSISVTDNVTHPFTITLTTGTNTPVILSPGQVFTVTATTPHSNGTSSAVANGTLTVGAPACLVPSISTQPSSASITYGDSDPSFSVTASGDGLSYQWQYRTNSTSTTWNNVGTNSSSYSVTGPSVSFSGREYRVVVSGTCGTATSSVGVLNVNPALLKVTADHKTKQYGEANPALSASLSGFVAGENEATSGVSGAASVSTMATQTSAVGDYVLEPSIGTLAAANYAFTFENGLLSVEKAPLTINNISRSKQYGTALANADFEGSITGMVAGDGITVLRSSDGEGATASVGTYSIIASLNDPYEKLSNYNITNDPGTLTITKGTQTITWDPELLMVWRSALSSSFLNATVAGVFGGSATGALSYNYSEGTILNPGTYTVIVTAAATTNYEEASKSVTLVVDRATANAIIVGTITNYTGGPVNYTSANVKGVDMEELEPGMTFSYSGTLSTGASYGPTPTVPTEAGTYTVVGTFAGNDFYKPATASATITIGKADLHVYANNQERFYGDDNPALTGYHTGHKNGENFALEFFTAATNTTAVGNYDIVLNNLLTGPTIENYNVIPHVGTLNIKKANLTITADAKSREYGDANPAFTGAINGAKNNEFFTVSGSSDATLGSSAGSYIIMPSVSGSTIDNYNVTLVNGTLTVIPRRITITADAKSKVYGDSDPVLTAQVTSGTIVGMDAVSGVLSRATGEDVGKYAIGKNTFTYGSNYNETFVGADLTIGQRTVTITADAQNKIYGEGDPELTYQVTAGSLAFSDAFTGKLDRVVGEDFGTYAIQIGDLSLNSNYVLAYVGANLTIEKRPITVTANAQYKIYGEIDPALTYQLTSGSLVAGDAFTGVLSRVSGENVGIYAIGKNTLSAGTNYNLTYVSANLSISARPITIAADTKSKYCGQTDPALTYAITNGSLVSTDNFSGTLTRNAGENSGSSYAINQGTLAINSNYDITYLGANLSILGVSIDASASGTPVPTGSDAVLTAFVSPAVAGISVTFKLDGDVKGTTTTDNSGKATYTVSGLTVKVYQVEAVAGSGCNTSAAYLPVYDPNGGFVTGGGWINSPAGAYVIEPSATGKANFGFVAKYKKGSTTLEGETEFQFQAGNLNFKSTSYEAATLVIGGAKASYRGVGTINGTGKYKFTLTAIDGQVTGGGSIDKIRMKIVTEDGTTTIYDNQIGSLDNADPSTILGGGSIVIHENKTTVKKTEIAAKEQQVEITSSMQFNLAALPNPTTSQFNVKLESNNSTEKITLRVVDLYGRTVQLFNNLSAGQSLQVGENYRPGVYIMEMIQGNSRKQLKLIKQGN